MLEAGKDRSGGIYVNVLWPGTKNSTVSSIKVKSFKDGEICTYCL